ncbi:MAG: hypothetical protein HOV81_45510 [Kofleriaceae bacterium]|nr:hypothetical protein [Kofleriaceae bacterium]
MARALVVGTIASCALVADASAAATKTTTSSKKKTASKKSAKKTATRTTSKKTKSKKRRTRARRKVATAKSHKVLVPSTPSVTTSSHHGDGRVRYGRDNMPPGFAWPPTKQMLAGIKACEATLSAAELPFEPAPPLGLLADPIYVPSMEIAGIAYTPAYGKTKPALDCQLARVLVAIGPQLYALGVRGVHYGSIYRNTNVRVHGQTKNILSRHALGLAMDIKAFVDQNGRILDVELEYLKGDPLLHAIEDTINKSTDFRIVLTPGNDPLSHYNHFHIEASVDYTGF